MFENKCLILNFKSTQSEGNMSIKTGSRWEGGDFLLYFITIFDILYYITPSLLR